MFCLDVGNSDCLLSSQTLLDDFRPVNLNLTFVPAYSSEEHTLLGCVHFQCADQKL